MPALDAERLHREDLERIRNFRLMDDDFMTKCFEDDPACVRLVLRVVLDKPDLEVLEVRTQVFVENLLDRSVRLDVLAEDAAGVRYNIEVQRSDRGAGRRRARYNSSMMDVNLLAKGESFDALPETYVIFITETDVLRRGQPVYYIERFNLTTGEPFGDGSHIVYVNGSYRGDTPVGRLMHDFFCTDPSAMYYTVLADRTRFFKESKKGVTTMCRVLEEMRDEYLQIGKKEGLQQGRQEEKENMTLRLLSTGKFPLEEIASLTGLTLDEVAKLKTAHNI